MSQEEIKLNESEVKPASAYNHIFNNITNNLSIWDESVQNGEFSKEEREEFQKELDKYEKILEDFALLPEEILNKLKELSIDEIKDKYNLTQSDRVEDLMNGLMNYLTVAKNNEK